MPGGVGHFRSKLQEKYHKRFIDTGEIPDAWNKNHKTGCA